ncbi:hypothetical protein ACFLRW_04290 [Acidobacteriota bacterium]
MNNKRFWLSTLLAWLVFIGIDFLIHASLLENLWKKEVSAIKSLSDLAILIPGGYLSFLLLTLLIGFVFVKIFPKQETFRSALKFGVIFGFLFSLSNLMGLFSYIRLPLVHLVFTNMGYFIEIIAVVLVYNSLLYPEKIKNKIWKTAALFFILVIIGVIIQNVFNQI